MPKKNTAPLASLNRAIAGLEREWPNLSPRDRRYLLDTFAERVDPPRPIVPDGDPSFTVEQIEMPGVPRVQR